jgi:hypothetical protein
MSARNENRKKGIDGLKSAIVVLLTLTLIWLPTGCGSGGNADSENGSGTETQEQGDSQDLNVSDGGAASDENGSNQTTGGSSAPDNTSKGGQAAPDSTSNQNNTDPATSNQQNQTVSDPAGSNPTASDQAASDPAGSEPSSTGQKNGVAALDNSRQDSTQRENQPGDVSGTLDEAGTNDKAAPENTGTGSDLIIPVSDVSDIARFYSVTVEGTPLEVLAVKAPDGSIRTAFNTCQVCFDSGRGYYEQVGSTLVCQNCGNRFSMDQVEVASGGCNPVPIFAANKTVTDDNITISYDFLKEAKSIFANWKGDY